jgi:hypothetical protein
VHDLDRRLAARARLQHDLFTLGQARDLGFTAAMIRIRRERGSWHELAPRVLIVNGTPILWRTKVMAACLSSGGIASHRTAAALHQVRGFSAGPIELTVARSHRLRPRDAILHRSKDLHRGQPLVIDQIPTTSVRRLVVDLGAVVPYHRFEAAVDDLIGRQRLTWDEAVLALAAHSRKGRNGCGPLRRLLDERCGVGVPESVLERTFLRMLTDRGVPLPVCQHEIRDRRGFIARVDFAYPDQGIAIELDSIRFHLDAATFERDHDKRARLAAAGWTVLAFTWRMVVDDPFGVASTVHRLLAEAA